MRSHLLLCSAAALGLWGCHVSFADHCSEVAHREAKVETAGITRIEIEAGAGELQITGQPGSTSVEAQGEACASSSKRLEDVQIFHEVRGSVLRIWTHRDLGETVRVGWVNDDAARLDLQVSLPSSIPVEVDDGSGDAVIKGVGKLILEDGSGQLELADLRGDVEIEDGSGDLEILGVDGNVEIEDGSGEVSLTGIKGDVKLEDGSGSVVIRQVGGTVVIAEDGSGDLEIVGAGRGAHVRVDGSGSIFVRDVTGDLRIDEDGSGSIEATGVTGEVKIPEHKREKR